MVSKLHKIGISWTLNPASGWGVYGLQIVRHMCFERRFSPVILEDIDLDAYDPLEASIVSPRIQTPLEKNPGVLEKYIKSNTRLPFPVLHARGAGLRPQFAQKSLGVIGKRNHALTFFENSHVSPQDVEIYNQFASVSAGSTWNGEILRNYGVERVGVSFQGVDPAHFHPAPRKGLFKDRFVIFAGGKMEYRKGQDIALRALKIFIDRHPEALLLCVWGNQWPRSWSYEQFRFSPYLDAAPPTDDDGKLDLAKWFELFGIGRENVLAFGNYPHRDLPALIREADVALFPNRCEGGTNLVAMETMACGIPTVVSANTGHLDIIHEGACLPLRDQAPVANASQHKIDTSGWGESSIEEILEHLEFVYDQRDEGRRIGLEAADKMHRFSWDNQISQLLDFIEEHGLS